jgi:GNAT superfamily N-acetyltransferase
MQAEFWEQLGQENEIGSIDKLPYVKIVEGSLVEIPVQKPDGSWQNCVSLLTHMGPTLNAPVDTAVSELGWSLRPALVLLSIFLPEELQRQGIGTRVIAALEKRAAAEGKLFAVGIIESDAMLNLCNKLGLTGCAPFSCYRKPALLQS